jgi:uncharacterized small protein (DUF1192 family)
MIANLSDAMAEIGRLAAENERLNSELKQEIAHRKHISAMLHLLEEHAQEGLLPHVVDHWSVEQIMRGLRAPLTADNERLKAQLNASIARYQEEPT